VHHENSGHGLLGGEFANSWRFLVELYIPRELTSSISALAFTKNKRLCGAFNLVETLKLKTTEVRLITPCQILQGFPFTNRFIDKKVCGSDLGFRFWEVLLYRYLYMPSFSCFLCSVRANSYIESELRK